MKADKSVSKMTSFWLMSFGKCSCDVDCSWCSVLFSSACLVWKSSCSDWGWKSHMQHRWLEMNGTNRTLMGMERDGGSLDIVISQATDVTCLHKTQPNPYCCLPNKTAMRLHTHIHIYIQTDRHIKWKEFLIIRKIRVIYLFIYLLFFFQILWCGWCVRGRFQIGPLC